MIIICNYSSFFQSNRSLSFSSISLSLYFVLHNSIDSNISVTWPNSIKNGSTVYAWVSYNSSTHNLSVFLSYADNPVLSEPSLSLIVNFTKILPQWVNVGFSAATGAQYETRTILHRSFNSTLEERKDGSKQNKLGLRIGVAVSTIAVGCVLGLIWFIYWRKRADGNIEDLGDDDSMDDEFEKGTRPRRFTYRELLNATNNFPERGKLGEGIQRHLQRFVK